MVYIRGHRSDYDDWAALGCKGWSYADVLPYFRRAEGNQNGGDAWHGHELMVTTKKMSEEEETRGHGRAHRAKAE